jgi:periodic tryptophan protein 1
LLFNIQVSTEDGLVQAFDVRNPKNRPIFTLHAHDEAVSSLDINPHIPGCLITGSGDKTVKIWCLEGDKPKCIASKDLEAGKVFSTSFSPDSPYTVAIAGSRGKVVIWNLEDNAAFKRGFPNRQFQSAGKARKEVLELEPDVEVESDSEEADEMMEGDYSEEEEGDHV